MSNKIRTQKKNRKTIILTDELCEWVEDYSALTGKKQAEIVRLAVALHKKTHDIRS